MSVLGALYRLVCLDGVFLFVIQKDKNVYDLPNKRQNIVNREKQRDDGL